MARSVGWPGWVVYYMLYMFFMCLTVLALPEVPGVALFAGKWATILLACSLHVILFMCGSRGYPRLSGGSAVPGAALDSTGEWATFCLFSA